MKRESKKRPAGGEKKKRKLGFTQIVCLLALTLGIGMAVWTLRPGKAVQTDAQGERIAWTGDPVEAQEIDYGDGDTLLRPGSEDIRYDEETGTLYFQNLLMVFFGEQPEDGEAETLAAAVGGEVVGLVREGCWLAQIRTPETDFAGLEALAQQLMDEQDNVLYASYDYPTFVENTLSGEDSNSWGGSGSYSFDEESHDDGNNWWAEAIGAYTAWQYTDWCADYTVGIVDSGFDFDHPELSGRITSLFEQDEEKVSKDEGKLNHGTHVAGIIGAENNTDGIRGIADTADLLVVNWSEENDEGVNYLSSGECYAANAKLVVAGAKAVNNSWGKHITSAGWYQLEGLAEGEISQFMGLTYSEYLDAIYKECEESGMAALLILNQLIASGKEQFLIVQSAGNGYNAGEGSLDSTWNGSFASVSLAQEKYESTTQSFYESANRTAISYEELREHILIVGAVQNEQNDKGQYLVHEGYNFGPETDIYAPGYEIYSTYYDSKYGEMNGTSMAAPMVTASAAMLWALDPSLTAEEVRDYLKNCDADGAVNPYGETVAMLNVGESVEALVHAKGITGKPEQTDSDTEVTEPTTPGTSGVRASKGDTSAGTFQDGSLAEVDGILYYYSEKENGHYALYSLDPISGESQELCDLDYVGLREYGSELLATDQYLYAKTDIDGRNYNVKIYNFAGGLVGQINDLCGPLYFDDGYLYYGRTQLNRVSVEDGLDGQPATEADPSFEPGISGEDTVAADEGFLVYDGYVYYRTDGGELVRVAGDGSGRTVLTEDAEHPLDLNGFDHIFDGMQVQLGDDNIVYGLNFTGSDAVSVQKLFVPGDQAESTSGDVKIEDGLVIGNVYIYSREQKGALVEDSRFFMGYSLATGESFEIAEDTSNQDLSAKFEAYLLHVAGASRLYYDTGEYESTTADGGYDHLSESQVQDIYDVEDDLMAATILRCIEIYGNVWYDLDIPQDVIQSQLIG